MTKKLTILFVSIMIVGVVALTARNGNGRMLNGKGTGDCIFIDENGDGINDNFRDHDGDGIPNFEDPDWVRPKDGTGYKTGQGTMIRKRSRAGNMGDSAFRNQSGFNRSFQTFNNFGGNFGSGTCDGSGSSTGRGRRGGK